MRRELVLLLLTLTGGLARADDPPKAPVAPPKSAAPAPAANPALPLTPEQAADAVVAAVKAKDDAALKALAGQDAPDPWLVADVLLTGRDDGVAERFAVRRAGTAGDGVRGGRHATRSAPKAKTRPREWGRSGRRERGDGR